MIETKNGEDIFIANASLGQITGVTKMSPALYQIRSDTGVTLSRLSPTCCCANCLQEEYDQCFNTANVAPWMYHTVIFQSGFAIRVLRSEPEPEEV